MKNKRSFLKTLILGYLIVTVISIFAIIILNIYSQETFKDYILEANESQLEKMTSYVEAVLDEMKETCVNVSYDKQITKHMDEWENFKEDVSSRIEIKKNIKQHLKDKYFDIFLYFPEEDYIISSSLSSVTSVNYYMSYFSQDREKAEKFGDFLDNENIYPDIDGIYAENGDTYICYAMKNVYPKEKLTFVTCVVLRPENAVDLMNIVTGERDVALFNREKELVATKNAEKIPYNIEMYDKHRENLDIKNQNEGYVMQVREFSKVGGYLGIITSTKLFWEQFSKVRIFSFMCMAVFVCVEGVIVYSYSKRQERPLGILTKHLEQGLFVQEDNDCNIKEFSLIRDMFARQLEEKKQLYEVVKMTKNDSKKFLLRRLLEGVDIEQIEKEGILNKSGIHFNASWFTVGMICIENHSDKEDLDIFIVRNVFEELLNCGYTGYMIQPEKFNYVFILNLKNKEDAENISNTLEEGKQFLEAVFQIRTTVAVSSVCEGLTQITKAYAQAKQAMEYRYLYGKGSKIFYQDICSRTYVYSENKKFLPLLQTFVMGEKQKNDTAEDCISELLKIGKIDKDISIKMLESLPFYCSFHAYLKCM